MYAVTKVCFNWTQLSKNIRTLDTYKNNVKMEQRAINVEQLYAFSVIQIPYTWQRYAEHIAYIIDFLSVYILSRDIMSLLSNISIWNHWCILFERNMNMCTFSQVIAIFQGCLQYKSPQNVINIITQFSHTSIAVLYNINQTTKSW